MIDRASPSLDEPLLAGLICFLLFIMVAAIIQLIDALFEPDGDPRCGSRRSGYRCIHDQDHPGSHRDEYGDYWN